MEGKASIILCQCLIPNLIKADGIKGLLLLLLLSLLKYHEVSLVVQKYQLII